MIFFVKSLLKPPFLGGFDGKNITMIRNLSKQEASFVLELEWRGQRIVSRSEVIETKNGDAKAADKLIRSLCKKNWLERIGAGKYMLIPAERGSEGVADMNTLLLGSLITSPYYFSYATANSFHNVSSQARREVFIACRSKLKPKLIREFVFRFIYLVRKKFFGYVETEVFGAKVMMADLEKAVVDSVDKPHYAGGIAEVASVIVRASRRCDWEKLVAYALKMDSVALVQRLGYLINCVSIEIPSDMEKKMKRKIKIYSRTYLGDVRKWGTKGTLDGEWQLFVNVPREHIISEI